MVDVDADHAHLGADGVSTFDERQRWHELATRHVAGVLGEFGFEIMDHGAEFADGLAELVRKQDDRCSLMLRFRPDLVTVLPTVRSLLVEIKSELPGKPQRDSWIMEAKAYAALREWNVGGNVAALVHCRPKPEGHVLAGWLTDVPPPHEVVLPQRADAEDQRRVIAKLFPGAAVKPCRSTAGSNTPFVCIPYSIMRPLREFIGLATCAVV